MLIALVAYQRINHFVMVHIKEQDFRLPFLYVMKRNQEECVSASKLRMNLAFVMDHTRLCSLEKRLSHKTKF